MGRSHQVLLLIMFVFSLQNQAAESAVNVSITLLQSAVSKGAVCLDGSPPGYAYLQGFGDGANKWIVFLIGGGWCLSPLDCYQRSLGRLGSSTEALKHYENKLIFSGMFDDNATINPAFHNWNKVQIIYCDGSSFFSDSKEVDPVYNISYRGGRIYDAIMEELMVNKGMARASDAILSGGSAGGLATILHCDKFGALFHKNATKVKCLSDSGFFFHGKDLIGADLREAQWFDLLHTHGLADLLPSSCTVKFSPFLCLFPEYLIPDIQTPLFLMESAFDGYQLGYNVFLHVPRNPSHWENCTKNLMVCNWTDIQIMKEFRTNVIKTLKSSTNTSSSIGYLVDSCYGHCHLQFWTESYLVEDNVLYHKTIGQVFTDWYFDDQTVFRKLDTSNNLPRNCTQP